MGLADVLDCTQPQLKGRQTTPLDSWNTPSAMPMVPRDRTRHELRVMFVAMGSANQVPYTGHWHDGLTSAMHPHYPLTDNRLGHVLRLALRCRLSTDQAMA